jgi:hypothetical protein
MPELPELETICRPKRSPLVGERIARVEIVLGASVMAALALFVACGGRTHPPDPAPFLGDWRCDGAPDGGVTGLFVSSAPQGPQTNGPNLWVATQGTPSGCEFRYVVSGSSAQFQGCGWSGSAPEGETGDECALLCGTIALEDDGGVLEGAFTFANPGGGASTPENVSCTRGGAIDGGLDASSTTDAGKGEDGAIASGEDAGLVDVHAACAASRDVFFAHVSPNPNPSQGSLGSNTMVFTNLDSQWMFESPLNVTATAGAQGPSQNLQVWMNDGGALKRGVYGVGPSSDVGVGFTQQGDGCQATSGTVSIDEYEMTSDDAGIQALGALALTFNVDCGNPVEGCVAYSTNWDASAPVDGAAGDGGLLAPCQSDGYVFYANAEGGYGTISDGVSMVTGAQGTWSAGLNGGYFELNVSVDPYSDKTWAVAATSSTGIQGPFQVGTYTAGPIQIGASISVAIAGQACTSSPTGTFTVAEASSDGSHALIGFDLQCSAAGSLRGCVSYGN